LPFIFGLVALSFGKTALFRNLGAISAVSGFVLGLVGFFATRLSRSKSKHSC
jgi:hypothetical protein